jgi:hypothetical protein
MNRVGRWIGVAFLVAAASGGCKKSRKDDAASNPPPAPAVGIDAAAAATGSAPTSTPGAAMTGEEMAAAYATCWGHYNAHAWDAYQACRPRRRQRRGRHRQAPGCQQVMAGPAVAAGFPRRQGRDQMTLVGDNHVVAVVRFTGTRTAPADPRRQRAAGDTRSTSSPQVADFDPATRRIVGRWLRRSGDDGPLGILQIPHRGPLAADLAERPGRGLTARPRRTTSRP